MPRLFPLLIFLLLTACGLAENEQDEKNKYSYITFSDPAFGAYCLANFDFDHDGRISRYEAQRVREIICPGLDIVLLTNLSEFIYLERLDCSRNRLAQLDLRKCLQLRSVDCSRNDLTGLNTENLGGLTTLNCAENALTSLDLASNTSLSALDARVNAFATLDISRCARNMSQADVRSNPSLATLYIGVGQTVSYATDGITEVVVR